MTGSSLCICICMCRDEEAIERAGTAPLTQLMIASQVKGLLGLNLIAL